MFKVLREEWSVCIKPALKVGGLIFAGQLTVGLLGTHLGVINDSNLEAALFLICVAPWWILLASNAYSIWSDSRRQRKVERRFKRKLNSR